MSEQLMVMPTSQLMVMPTSNIYGAVDTNIIGQNTENAVNELVRKEMVREAAYYKAEKRGFMNGDPVQDWFEAEHEIGEQLSACA